MTKRARYLVVIERDVGDDDKFDQHQGDGYMASMLLTEGLEHYGKASVLCRVIVNEGEPLAMEADPSSWRNDPDAAQDSAIAGLLAMAQDLEKRKSD